MPGGLRGDNCIIFDPFCLEGGIDQMRQGLAIHEATGVRVFRPHFLTLLAEALGTNSQAKEGLSLLDEALETVHRNREESHLAEIYRVKGELLLKTFTIAGAEECFDRSLKIAQQQQAKSLELRAAMSIARLCKQQNRREDAQALLTPIYNGFTEGFDTKNLREAKALINELSLVS